MPIEDYYGTGIQVDPVMASPGPMVDVELLFLGRSDSLRLYPAQAQELGEQLIAAASPHGEAIA